MKLSIVIPAHNEEGCIEETINELHENLQNELIEHEIVVVNDHSMDATEKLLVSLQKSIPTFRYLNNTSSQGFGLAVRKGLECFDGDIVAIYMADGSDCPEDLVRFVRTIETTGVDCVFGSRF